MSNYKPDPGKPTTGPKPQLSILPEKIEWRFSFRYFNEIEFFGLQFAKPGWMSSLLDRLRTISMIDVIEFHKITSKKDRESLRYHPIDWNSKNIPIQRKDLTWLDKKVIDNIEEVDFFQFHLSKSLGRIVGYWASDYSVFYVVLVDPMHNIQPSGDYNYRVDPCEPAETDFAILHKVVDDTLKQKCNVSNCTMINKLREAFNNVTPSNLLVIHIDDQYYDVYQAATSTSTGTEFVKDALIEYTLKK